MVLCCTRTCVFVEMNGSQHSIVVFVSLFPGIVYILCVCWCMCLTVPLITHMTHTTSLTSHVYNSATPAGTGLPFDQILATELETEIDSLESALPPNRCVVFSGFVLLFLHRHSIFVHFNIITRTHTHVGRTNHKMCRFWHKTLCK